MCASRRSAVWPQVVAIALMGLGAAGCSSDSGRFAGLSAPTARARRSHRLYPAARQPRREPRTAASGSNAGDGASGGGRGMGSYQPGNGDVTGSPVAPPPPPPPRFTWEGGTPITVAPGETLETISRRYGVPVAAIMEANSITRPGDACVPGSIW